MINKKAISLNILFSLLQILVTGIAYYFLYQFLLFKLGADLMGVWAIVLSVSSTANVANMGIGASVVRYTAKFKVNEEINNLNTLLHTSLLFLGAVFSVVCLLVYLVAPIWLHAVIKTNLYNSAIEIIPFSLLCLILNALSGVFFSCIDGLQKNYIRSIIFIFSFTVFLTVIYWLVPRYGLMGVAYAQLVQAFFLLLSSAASLKLVFKPLRLFPLVWDRVIFKKIFSFGIQEQIISFCQLCFDPFTKSILGGFGNLSMVTYYEMANRLVTQLRSFLVSANQVFIPVFTSTNEHSADSVQQLYRKVFTVNFLLSLFWLSFILASVVPISRIWIGQVNQEFIIISILLAAGYWCNIIISPAYFSNMGMASLKDNVIGNLIIAVFNVLFCIGIGYFLNGYGVVIGWCIALAAGSLYIMFMYHYRNFIQIKSLLVQQDVITLALCTAYSLFCLSIFWLNTYLNVGIMFGIDILMFSILCISVYYINPSVKRLISLLKSKT